MSSTAREGSTARGPGGGSQQVPPRAPYGKAAQARTQMRSGLPGVLALTVVYDDGCVLCQRAHRWLTHQRTALPMRFVACSSSEAQRRFGALPWLGDQLMVLADDGRVWAGPPAFVMCLWGLRDYRWLSRMLAHRSAWPLAARLFATLSAERDKLGAWLAPPASHGCADNCCSQPIERPRGPYR